MIAVCCLLFVVCRLSLLVTIVFGSSFAVCCLFGCSLFAVRGLLLLVVRCSLFVAHCVSFVNRGSCSLLLFFVGCVLLFVIGCVLFVVCCVLYILCVS